MKIIVSSKHLASVLSKIDFNSEHVESIKVGYVDKHNIKLKTTKQELEIWGECLAAPNLELNQRGTSWSLAKRFMNAIEDQPITLNLSDCQLNINFSF